MDYAATRKAIVEAFPGLSPQLQQAARFVLDRPDEVGLNTLRDVAGMAGVQPATIVRFVRALGFDGYKQFRFPYVQRLRGRTAEYANRARTLQARGADVTRPLLEDIRAAELENISSVFDGNQADRLGKACDIMLAARRVYVLGLRGSFSVAFAFHYSYSMFRTDAVLLDGRGGTFADALRRIRPDDVLFVVGFSPYTDSSVRAAKYALGKGAKLIALTDSIVSPLAKDADVALFAADDSPSFYQSFVGPMALTQALVAMIASRGGEDVLEDIAESERQLEEFGAYWQESPVKPRKGSRK